MTIEDKRLIEQSRFREVKQVSLDSVDQGISPRRMCGMGISRRPMTDAHLAGADRPLAAIRTRAALIATHCCRTRATPTTQW